MINHDLRCIYVHIPKTAGNSINRVFGVSWEDHKDLGRYAADMPAGDFARYFKFAIVRNPWDRLFSDYNYQLKKSRARHTKLFLYDEAGAVRTFAQWVRAVLADPYRYAPESWGGEVSPGVHRWSPQVDWIAVNGRSQLDFVVRMEDLQADFSQVCRTLGIPPVRLPHRNRRLHCHYSWYYDNTTRDLVSEYYAQDITAFGYRFEASPIRAAFQRTQGALSQLLSGLREPEPTPPFGRLQAK